MDRSERATADFAGTPAFVQNEGTADMTDVTEGWHRVCALEAIPRLGARVVRSARGNIAVFRTQDDEVFALLDKCPHKGGPLSQGIVFGRRVACPLHGWNIGLDDGSAVAPDVGCTRSYPVKIEDSVVFLQVTAPPAQ